MFAGDFLSRDQYMSLACMLHSAVPHSNYTMIREGILTTLIFWDYGVKLMLNRNEFLVNVAAQKIGAVLKLDTVSPASKLWAESDMIVFNTLHWWSFRGALQPWKFMKIGIRLYKDMNRTIAFEIGVKTWAKWVDTMLDPTKTMVFFQGASPSHYYGADWHEPGENCVGQKRPLKGSTYAGGLPLPNARAVQKKVVTSMRTRVKMLDITALSQMRIDGHPSSSGESGRNGTDCNHWCLAGVPDTWNSILYNFIFQE